jgi:hypothetical protein
MFLFLLGVFLSLDSLAGELGTDRLVSTVILKLFYMKKTNLKNF